jgi:hypothetical protein
MYLLTNKDKREIALPAPNYGAVILAIGATHEVTDDHHAEILKSHYTADAIERGTVVVEHFKTKAKAKKSDAGVKLLSVKGGKWKVYVNGEAVIDEAVSKKEAQRIAAEYE